MARRDLIAALVLLGFTAGFGLLTLRLPDRGLPNTPGPAFFPGLITLALGILTIALLVRSLRGIAVEPAVLPGAVATRGWIAIGAFVVYLIVMPALGFLFASVPFFAVLTWVYGERRLAVVTLTSIAVPVALLVIFRSGFQILLPSGIGW